MSVKKTFNIENASIKLSSHLALSRYFLQVIFSNPERVNCKKLERDFFRISDLKGFRRLEDK